MLRNRLYCLFTAWLDTFTVRPDSPEFKLYMKNHTQSWYHILSHVISCGEQVSCDVTKCHTMSRHMISHDISCFHMSHDITRCHMMSHDVKRFADKQNCYPYSTIHRDTKYRYCLEVLLNWHTNKVCLHKNTNSEGVLQR